MKVIKITAIWCSACLVMNTIWDKVSKKMNIETLSLDLDFDEDEVKRYIPGDILPVFIIMNKDKEIKRIVGEHSEEELIKLLQEIGD